MPGLCVRSPLSHQLPKLICSLPSPLVVKSSCRADTMPVFPETVPVRTKSGHFTRLSGSGHREKSAGRSPSALLLELYHTVISFSDGKIPTRGRKPCRYFQKPCRSAIDPGETEPFTGPDYHSPFRTSRDELGPSSRKTQHDCRNR